MPAETPAADGGSRAGETRGNAIEAAILCLAELGYAQTTLQVIARRMGMSHGPLQYHFRSKVDLMAAVAERLLRGRAAAFAPLVAEASPGAGVLSRYLDAAESYCRSAAFLASVELLVAARADAGLREAIGQATESRQRLQQETFARLLARKAKLDPARVLALTDLVAALAAGVAVNRSAGALPELREAPVWRLLETLVAGTRGSKDGG